MNDTDAPVTVTCMYCGESFATVVESIGHGCFADPQPTVAIPAGLLSALRTRANDVQHARNMVEYVRQMRASVGRNREANIARALKALHSAVTCVRLSNIIIGHEIAAANLCGCERVCSCNPPF